MIRLRKWLILLHRYLGIVLSVFFVVWFLSGIGMMYAGGMPQLTPELRLERMPPLDFARIRVGASDAVAKAGFVRSPGRLVLLTVMDRPAYRVIAGPPTTVFADSGQVLEEADQTAIMTIASLFADVPVAKLRDTGVLTSADQWTIAQRHELPLHKIVVDDQARTELYVSPQLGEVVLQTTRASRTLAWAAAIPHWLYFAALRTNDAVWRQVILWVSGLGIVLALAGLTLGVMQFSPARPFRLARVGSYNPYAGWMRWHYIMGVVFGAFTLTWVFSGLLSMEPWDWVSREGSGAGMTEALTGGPLDLSQYPPADPIRWTGALAGRPVKEIEFLRIQGDPYYVARGVEAKPILLVADALQVKREAFSMDSLVSRAVAGNPEFDVLESRVLSDYDAYYYARDRKPPLPVLRMKFDDPAGTWFYIDPGMGQVVARFTHQERVERWLYHGLHSLDFSFWYYNRPLWDAGVIALSLGGAASSGIGLYLGWKRVARSATRRVR